MLVVHFKLLVKVFKHPENNAANLMCFHIGLTSFLCDQSQKVFSLKKSPWWWRSEEGEGYINFTFLEIIYLEMQSLLFHHRLIPKIDAGELTTLPVSRLATKCIYCT
jgi:hypothetical protein